jgi:hypothetical protein
VLAAKQVCCEPNLAVETLSDLDSYKQGRLVW